MRKYETYIENIIQSPNSKDTIQWPKDTIQWPKDTVQWPKDTVQWPKDTIQWPKDTVQWPKDTIQWPKEKGQKDKQWLKNATQKTFRNTNPTKNRDALSIHIVSKWTLPNIDLTIVVH